MKKEPTEKRQRLHEENAEILSKAAKEGRDVLMADEEQEWQSRDAAIDALTKNIMMRMRQDEIERRIGEVEERKTQPAPAGGSAGLSQLDVGGALGLLDRLASVS